MEASIENPYPEITPGLSEWIKFMKSCKIIQDSNIPWNNLSPEIVAENKAKAGDGTLMMYTNEQKKGAVFLTYPNKNDLPPHFVVRAEVDGNTPNAGLVLKDMLQNLTQTEPSEDYIVTIEFRGETPHYKIVSCSVAPTLTAKSEVALLNDESFHPPKEASVHDIIKLIKDLRPESPPDVSTAKRFIMKADPRDPKKFKNLIVKNGKNPDLSNKFHIVAILEASSAKDEQSFLEALKKIHQKTNGHYLITVELQKDPATGKEKTPFAFQYVFLDYKIDQNSEHSLSPSEKLVRFTIDEIRGNTKKDIVEVGVGASKEFTKFDRGRAALQPEAESDTTPITIFNPEFTVSSFEKVEDIFGGNPLRYSYGFEPDNMWYQRVDPIRSGFFLNYDVPKLQNISQGSLYARTKDAASVRKIIEEKKGDHEVIIKRTNRDKPEIFEIFLFTKKQRQIQNDVIRRDLDVPKEKLRFMVEKLSDSKLDKTTLDMIVEIVDDALTHPYVTTCSLQGKAPGYHSDDFSILLPVKETSDSIEIISDDIYQHLPEALKNVASFKFGDKENTYADIFEDVSMPDQIIIFINYPNVTQDKVGRSCPAQISLVINKNSKLVKSLTEQRVNDNLGLILKIIASGFDSNAGIFPVPTKSYAYLRDFRPGNLRIVEREGKDFRSTGYDSTEAFAKAVRAKNIGMRGKLFLGSSKSNRNSLLKPSMVEYLRREREKLNI